MSDQGLAPTSLRVCMFSGASSLPILVAKRLSLFARAGIDVELHLTRSSQELMQGLIDGQFDIVHAAPGNFVEWRDNTGVPIVAWLGGTSGPLRLMSAPGIGEMRALAGRGIAVDSPASGFVSVLRKMLRAGGLDDDDVALVPLGSTQRRYEALRAGETSATMLSLPWSILAERAGCIILADQDAVLPRLQGSCGASLAGWLEANPGPADAYLRTLCAAVTWLHDPSNSEDANRFLIDHYDIDENIADTVRRSIMDPRSGWPPSGMIDPQGMEAVCALRTENGRPPAASPSSYYTLEPYRRVLGFELLE